MRYLVMSDLHANREALRAVLEDASRPGFDGVLLLGDVVGYGADPGAVIDALRPLPGLTAVRGNHDRVAAGLDAADDFNPPARAAARWTRDALSPEDAGFLRGLPRGPRAFAPRRLLSHGSPLDEDEYLLDAAQARRCFEGAAFDLCFFGHTHLPGMFVEAAGAVSWVAPGRDDGAEALLPGRRYLVNPGSVGQPRDRDPRAAYVLYDDAAARVLFRRVPYAFDETRRRILEAGLPAWLGDRLALGA
jgi:predicted phosphodiesterase